ncbi:MAG: cupin domain-containing protein [Terrimicrobiaceae bacterium]|nr:cupin domain-containing protein [Terrimicrobiaceae bacterium]
MSHRFHLRATPPQFSSECGRRTFANATNFPLLKNLSIYHLAVNPGCFREPHWHANADELAYCLAGDAVVTLFASGNVHSQFTISEGEMFFIPSGALHAIENTGNVPAEFVITFSHELPEDFGLSGFAGCLAPSVLANTWGLPVAAVSGVTRSPADIRFGKSAGPAEIPESASYGTPFKFSIEKRLPLVASEHGSAIVARRDTWPILRAQAMYSLRLFGSGMREPHWHPETAELGYVHTGRARMTVQSPGGAAETYELAAGDIYFIPRAYPHHIENLTDGEMRFLIFFDTPDVQDIGFTGAIPAFADRLTGPTLGLTAAQIARIPHLPADLLLVAKTNPVD